MPSALADGFRRAYEVFGDESRWYAFEVHGCASPTYDVRNKYMGNGLIYATSHNGARMGAGIPSGLHEALTLCIFLIRPLVHTFGSMEKAAEKFLNACYGRDIGVEDIYDISLRNYYFNRCVSLREGYHPSVGDRHD